MATKARAKRVPKGGEPAVEKENVNVSPMPSKDPAKKNTTKLSLQEELESVTRALKEVSLEKEENDAKLRERDEQLSAQAAEAERIQNLLKSSDEEKKRLEEKVRKLQKVQGFQPTLVCFNFVSKLLIRRLHSISAFCIIFDKNRTPDLTLI
jgi:hypothetical protein